MCETSFTLHVRGHPVSDDRSRESIGHTSRLPLGRPTSDETTLPLRLRPVPTVRDIDASAEPLLSTRIPNGSCVGGAAGVLRVTDVVAATGNDPSIPVYRYGRVCPLPSRASKASTGIQLRAAVNAVQQDPQVAMVRMGGRARGNQTKRRDRERYEKRQCSGKKPPGKSNTGHANRPLHKVGKRRRCRSVSPLAKQRQPSVPE